MKEYRSVYLNGLVINYLYEKKNVKNINLRIKKDKTIYVSANYRIDVSYIDDFVLKNYDFILNAQSKFDKVFINENQSLNDGGRILFLGNSFDVKSEISSKNFLKIDFYDKKAIFCLKDVSTNNIREKIYEKWQNICAQEVFEQVLNEIFPMFNKYSIDFPNLQFRKFKSRWGSMNIKTKTMSLNYFLLDAPYECIKYVIIHELSHLIVPNHSKNFYLVVKDIMPDYKHYENILKNFTTRKRFF